LNCKYVLRKNCIIVLRKNPENPERKQDGKIKDKKQKTDNGLTIFTFEHMIKASKIYYIKYV